MFIQQIVTQNDSYASKEKMNDKSSRKSTCMRTVSNTESCVCDYWMQDFDNDALSYSKTILENASK